MWLLLFDSRIGSLLLKQSPLSAMEGPRQVTSQRIPSVVSEQSRYTYGSLLPIALALDSPMLTRITTLYIYVIKGDNSSRNSGNINRTRRMYHTLRYVQIGFRSFYGRATLQRWFQHMLCMHGHQGPQMSENHQSSHVSSRAHPISIVDTSCFTLIFHSLDS